MTFNKKLLQSFLSVGALATACASWGCVADRPARNGVFNENQYIRKDFLIRPATSGAVDPGWIFRSTVTATSAPNPLGQVGLFVGSDNSSGPNLVRFAVTEDKLQMINMRELTAGYPDQGAREPEILNAWPITNVDLKYRVDLDGETTNFYEENQELDWQVRQWIKLTFDKNDLSDVAPLGPGMAEILSKCTDTTATSTTLVPGSFLVDETNNYITWQTQITAPVLFTDQGCTDAYGAQGILFQQVGRNDVTFTLSYSLVRAAPDSNIWTPERALANGDVQKSTYVPFVLAEKDPIRKKYGIFETIAWNRDPNTELLAAQEFLNRYNPNADFMDWYLCEGYPSQYEAMWTTPGGFVDQTNQLFKDAGAKVRMRVWRYNDDTSGIFGNGKGLARQFGDVRYNFVHWVSDLDVVADGGIFLGDTPSLNDPRTGERISTVINIADFNLLDYYGTKLDYYLQTIGAEQAIDPKTGEWPAIAGTCYVGQTYPLGGLDFTPGGTVQVQHNEISTVYDKMQLYLHKPSTTYGYLNPSDFIPQQTPEFFDAFFRIMPYEVFDDPATNPFVIPEGGQGNYAPTQSQLGINDYETRSQFHALMSVIDKGEDPYHDDPSVGYFAPPNSYDSTGGGNDVAAAQAFTDSMKALNGAVYNQRFITANPVLDTPAIIDNFTLFEKDARHCIWKDPQDHSQGTEWESRAQYLQTLITSTWTTVVLHEFGHAVGLRHNFMGSVDRNNFPTWTDSKGGAHVGAYTSSIMEYNTAPDRYFWAGGVQASDRAPNTNPWSTQWNGLPGWLPYDMAAISFLYGNNLSVNALGPYGPSQASTVSGQTTLSKSPWHDPHGFNSESTEINFLFCTDQHLHFSPFCRQFDFGTTPSEIVASAIDTYEWNYRWRNFRLYRKFWNDGPYADGVAGTFIDLRRFLSTWAYDWSQGELIENFPKVGVKNPPDVPLIAYYGNLAQAFTNDISTANQMVAAFHKAIIQQSSGERPYVTTYEPFFGDVVQQGIIIDKLIALQNWTSLFQIDNYDPTQAAGAYLFAATPFDSNYDSVAEDALDSMIGGEYDVFPYVSPLSIQMFSEASHDINFTGRTEIRDWIGGKVFGGPGLDPNEAFLDTMRSIAQQVNAQDIDPVVFAGCSQSQLLTACLWDPRIIQTDVNDVYHSDSYNEFRGPDGRRYAWSFVADRNQIAVVDRDRNTASYVVIRNYNQDVVTSQDDGSQGAYSFELPIKYTMDAFATYN